MIVYRRKGLVFGEAFYEPLAALVPKVDILRVTASDVLPDAASRARLSRTRVIDLRRAEETLFDEMDKGTRYEVRRAMERDKLDYGLDDDCPDREIGLFCDYYDRFAASKNRRPIFRKRLTLLARHGMLVLTQSRSGDGEVLVWHSYLRCAERVVLLYSASLFREKPDASVRNLIGRANRFTHWNDILAFKRMGKIAYDMGGIDVAGRSRETSNIADFKHGFGGSDVPVYSHTLPRSIAGHVACRIAEVLGIDL